MVDADGRQARLLFTLGAAPVNFAWSPDGSQIAFFGDGLMLMDADGTNAHSLKDVTSVPRFFPPRWSPDGRYLAITDSHSLSYSDPWNLAAFEDAMIYIVEVETGKDWPLVADGSAGHLDPAWSPDGSQIVFASTRSGAPELWLAHPDGSNLRQLTDAGQFIRFPFWRRP